MEISEREKQLISMHSRMIIGNIKYHLTSHWIDLVMWIFKIKQFNFKKQNQKYLLNYKKKLNIKIDYLGNKPIKMKFNFKNFSLETKSLEELYYIANNKKKLILNENKLNKFKPGLLKISKNIKRNVLTNSQNDLIPKVNNLINLYDILNFIKK